MTDTALHTLTSAALLGLALATIAPHSASARPRDDALSSSFRCASIGDMRGWLDCYYGAAQPVRAALGLPPVPAAQSRLVANPPAGNPSSADLLLRNQVMSLAVGCSPESGARQWLDCYYESARPVRVHLGLETPPPSHAVPAGPVQATLPAEQPPRPAHPASGNTRNPTRMKSFTFDRLGYFTVTLENGQVWKQINGDTSYAHWKKPAESYLVRISRGFLGSENISVLGEPGLFRVQRLR